ncbi:Uncharacterized protein dnl_30640 [Desulfonema limicola]|uniref:Uncharacterized protein n=1 Tax=Desulfonema limicola TaxID=45656 RepID=A0A975B8S0_9BACT|nr:Uncharacterized protein dnl_30640 [Desulfonema limicola]
MFSWKYNCEGKRTLGELRALAGFNPCFHGSTTVRYIQIL